MASMTQAKVKNSWNDNCSAQMCLFGNQGWGRDGADRQQEIAPQPQPWSTLLESLLPEDLPGLPLLLKILAHTRERLSTGCPVSMETSSPISIFCPFALAPLGSRREATLGEACHADTRCRPHCPTSSCPPDHPPSRTRIGPQLKPHHPSSFLAVGPAGSHARGLDHGLRSLGLGALPIHVLLNHLKKMHPAPGRIC